MQNLEIELPMPDGRKPLPGFRLRRLEMLNWGTFHGKVAILTPDNQWTLLVGENGSGKSTAVDALRTLLVPPKLLNYNDASTEQKRRNDRTRRSYIRGAWATSSQEDSAAARIEYLRKPGEQSILLAVFANERSRTEITIAQVLWELNDKVNEVFSVARSDKNIREHVCNLGKTIELKKTLRARGFEPFDSFTGYEETFRGRLGISGRAALEVFNQAIGVKEIVDLNQFLRRHMLEVSDAVEFINERLRPHFKELDACWHAIQKAEAQITKLAPIAECHRRVEEANARKKEWDQLLQIAPVFYANVHFEHCVKELGVLQQRIDELVKKKTELEFIQNDESEQRVNLELELNNDAAGLRIKAIEMEQKQTTTVKNEKQQRADILRTALNTLQKGAPADTEEQFIAMRAQVSASKGLLEGNHVSSKQKQLDFAIENQNAIKLRGEIARELESLRKARVLIPSDFVRIREQLSKVTSIATEDLPFAGELVEVKVEFRDWTGAIERLLHSLGVSLLVPEKHYLVVTRFINDQHLGLRLTYHRVPPNLPAFRGEVLADAARVPARLNFRDHSLQGWVKAEIARRFNHVCCPDIQRLKQEDFGITQEGLIRNGPTQHVKDDRRQVNDATNFVLGWSTESKIRALTKAYEAADKKATDAESHARAAALQVKNLEEKLKAVEIVLAIQRFVDVDFRSELQTLDRLQKEKDELEGSSDRRKTLKKQLVELKARIEQRQKDIGKLENVIGGLQRDQKSNEDLRAALEAELSMSPALDFSAWEEQFANLQDQKRLNLAEIPNVKAQVLLRLRGNISHQTGLINSAEKEMLPKMSDFLHDYSEESANLKAESEYATEFVALRERLEKEDLPKHRKRFEEFLGTNLVGDMAMFSTKLSEHEKMIRARVTVVNRALTKTPFSKGTHVEIVMQPTRSDEIRAFRAELKNSLSGGLNPSAEDRLRIFTQIRELISKFEKDDNWTHRVTDARNWLEFGVREVADSDGHEVAYYAVSSGKSGGQKVRLAFTILGSAIAAQYGVSGSEDESSTFRLVVIDEAFARTDEANSRRALELFKSLGLQLLVVSPFDAKGRIVEDHVHSFHLAVNPEGNSSRVLRASREEYEAAREEAVTATDHAKS